VESDGRKELFIEVADSLFLNGLTPLNETTLLAAESILGRIYKLDLTTRTAEVWLSSDTLGKITSFAFMPGANGIKVFGDHVYVTNTDRATVIRVPVQKDGTAGSPEAEHLRGDDFAFSQDGSVYITTHIENSVVKLAPDGRRIAVAGPEQGMPGSTAIAFGRTGKESPHAFVTTTGGLLRPYNRTVTPAKLIRLELPTAGAVIPYAV
jgi:sugar lactone lactonase YvrE